MEERGNRGSCQVLQQPCKALHVCPPLQHQFQNQSQHPWPKPCAPDQASLMSLFPFSLPCLCLLGCPKSLCASCVPRPPKSAHMERRWGTTAPSATTSVPASAPAWVAQQPQLSSLAATGGSQIQPCHHKPSLLLQL